MPMAVASPGINDSCCIHHRICLFSRYAQTTFNKYFFKDEPIDGTTLWNDTTANTRLFPLYLDADRFIALRNCSPAALLAPFHRKPGLFSKLRLSSTRRAAARSLKRVLRARASEGDPKPH